VGAAYLRRRLGGSAVVFVLFTAFAPLAAITYGIFSACGTGEQVAPQMPDANISEAVDSATGGTMQSPPSPPLLVLGVLLLTVAILGVVLLRQARGGVAADIDEEELEEASETLEAIGEAAGEAADRIEADAGLDNEVYRAWREMADLLDHDRPETSTPGEFADAAVDVGMNPDDVSELTRLFEEVRYGEAPATEEREQRAVEALRRIESEYGAPEADPEYDARNRDEGGGE